MKIAVLTSGLLPVPAVQGGAVENLIDFYLEYNEIHHLHDITVYSISNPLIQTNSNIKSNYNHYHYVNIDSYLSRIKRKIYHLFHKNEYHHYFIEYFLEQSIKHIRKHKYDCIILENRPSYALKLKTITNAKLVYHLHNEKLTIKTPSYKAIYDAASLIICVSDFITNSVKSIDPTSTKCFTVNNGIDLTAFSIESSEISRQSIGLNYHDFVVIYSGRINPEKGILELTEAMNMLTDYPQIKLLVIGSSFFGDTNEDNSFIQQLRNKTKNIQNRIVFTGFIPYKNVPSYLKLADIAVVPSMWDEAFGLTVLEAMATGLPLITTRSGGIPEICQDSAIIIDREDIVINLAKAIIMLYKEPATRIELSKRSILRSQDFSKEKYANNFFKTINTIKV